MAGATAGESGGDDSRPRECAIDGVGERTPFVEEEPPRGLIAP